MIRNLGITEQGVFCSGHSACPGCIEALSVRHIMNVIGPDAVAVIPPSCMAVISGLQPYSSLRIPVYQTTLESSAASASGIRRALNQRGKHDTQVVVLAGDGGTYDIGFQSLSSAVERNEEMIYICLDNEGYMNTGGQKSSASPQYATTGSTPAGKTSKKKNLTEIMAAHEIPYVATASAGHLDDLIYKVNRAKTIRGTKVITVLIPCLDGWGLADNFGIAAARLAVDTGVFPLYEVEDGIKYTLNHATKTRPVGDYLHLQRRYKHLRPEDVAAIQSSVDINWARLLAKASV
jgi:pyruvate ferredoxin oxidoreductase beta subunit/2-oxoisovalerate ferredoxin oxidoreductase beta subunit